MDGKLRLRIAAGILERIGGIVRWLWFISGLDERPFVPQLIYRLGAGEVLVALCLGDSLFISYIELTTSAENGSPPFADTFCHDLNDFQRMRRESWPRDFGHHNWRGLLPCIRPCVRKLRVHGRHKRWRPASFGNSPCMLRNIIAKRLLGTALSVVFSFTMPSSKVLLKSVKVYIFLRTFDTIEGYCNRSDLSLRG